MSARTRYLKRLFVLSFAFVTAYLLFIMAFKIPEHFRTKRKIIIVEGYNNSFWNQSVALSRSEEIGINDLMFSCPEETIVRGICETNSENTRRCAMMVNAEGRLGNLMGEYATLLALSRWNQRPAFMLRKMADVLRGYFHVTMLALDESAESCLWGNWHKVGLHDWMEDSYKSIRAPSDQAIMLTGWPCSWTFYHHIRDEILSEFTLRDDIKARAQRTLKSFLGSRSTATFVGVHARRSDYIPLMAGEYRGVVANAHFFAEAMAHFRSRYSDAIFVVASDDMEWCRNNINNTDGDVYYAGVGNITDPIHDFAILTQCNHSIITIGTFGYWTAYLAGGDTVYLTNYTLPDSPFLKVFHYKDAYLPSWKPIAAELPAIPETTKMNKTLTVPN